jgi:hypothetical protein
MIVHDGSMETKLLVTSLDQTYWGWRSWQQIRVTSCSFVGTCYLEWLASDISWSDTLGMTHLMKIMITSCLLVGTCHLKWLVGDISRPDTLGKTPFWKGSSRPFVGNYILEFDWIDSSCPFVGTSHLGIVWIDSSCPFVKLEIDWIDSSCPFVGTSYLKLIELTQAVLLSELATWNWLNGLKLSFCRN